MTRISNYFFFICWWFDHSILTFFLGNVGFRCNMCRFPSFSHFSWGTLSRNTHAEEILSAHMKHVTHRKRLTLCHVYWNRVHLWIPIQGLFGYTMYERCIIMYTLNLIYIGADRSVYMPSSANYDTALHDVKYVIPKLNTAIIFMQHCEYIKCTELLKRVSIYPWESLWSHIW